MSLCQEGEFGFCLLGLVWEGDLWWEVAGNAAEQTWLLQRIPEGSRGQEL